MKNNLMPIPFEKPKIVQTVVRTDKSTFVCCGYNDLNEHLEKGWLVAHITPTTDYIEYILQKEVE